MLKSKKSSATWVTGLLMLVSHQAWSIDIQDLVSKGKSTVQKFSPSDDCGQKFKRLSLSSVHTLAAAACSLNSINMTERKDMETQNAENHFHDWNVIDSEEGFYVRGYCSRRVLLQNRKVSEIIDGQKMKIDFLVEDMSKCNPVVKGKIGGRTVRFKFEDENDHIESNNIISGKQRRILSRLDIGTDFPMDWVRGKFSSPWMGSGNTEDGRELGLGNRSGVDFKPIRMHMIGSRALTAALAMRWDFLISGDQVDDASGRAYTTKNLLIKMTNSLDGPSAGMAKTGMSYGSKDAQNVFYSTGFAIDPDTGSVEPYVTNMRGCSDLIFNGTLFDITPFRVESCQARFRRYSQYF